MATAYSSSAASATLPHRNGAMYRSPAPPAASSSQPAGTFLSGTKVQVGSHRVTIEKYLSEGGFAHVYVVRVPRSEAGSSKYDLAVLKRVAVPDKDHLASMRTEVETMKKLKGHHKVVTYMDSHASQLKGGGYEVFLLMEYCAGGGLIDFMNTRLQHRLTEPEILKIFGDVAEGVACMHYLKPPLLHRDLKVENVLISKSSGGSPTYKLCDFGSTAPPRPAAKTAEEGRLIEEDVQKHTTMQYRSPEMIDVWRKQPIDEKADIWALGVLLYKLCYYTTPFEDVGQMAILNASYKFPTYPSFSERLKKLIASTLKEDPKRRPNIYEVIREVCSMRSVTVPIKDIYAGRTQSEARRNETMPSAGASSPDAAAIGLQKLAQPQVQVQAIPDIAPMRRGRPISTAKQQAPVAAKPSPSPARGDPFAALDSKNYDVRVDAVEELAKRFPSLDEFSIAHETGGGFPFSQDTAAKVPPGGLSVRVTNALADEVFGQAEVPKSSRSSSQLQQQQQLPNKTSPTKPKTLSKARDVQQQSPLMHQPTPVRPGMSSAYKSTGVGSSPPPTSLKPSGPAAPELSKRAIWRVPAEHHRSASTPRASDSSATPAAAAAASSSSSLQPGLPRTQRPALQESHRSKSQISTVTQQTGTMSPTSSRPSLEGHRRPSHLEIGGEEAGLSRAKSAQSRPRPSSVYVSSNLDYLRDQEAMAASSRNKRPSMDLRRHSRQPSRDRDRDDVAVVGDDGQQQQPIDSDIDYLRTNEDNNESAVRRKPSKGRKSSSSGGGGHKKRASLPGTLAAGAKSVWAGRFGDAFKRFERDSGDDKDEAEDSRPVTPPMPEREGLSPIEGSEKATPPTKPSQEYHHAAEADDVYGDEEAIDETEDLPPDVRRELERRRLSQEEKRVVAAAAEYRARVGTQGTGGGGVTRASTIQKRVQSLLDEGRQSPGPIRKTAEGYGKYTQGSEPAPARSEVPPAKAQPPVALAARSKPSPIPVPMDPAVNNNPYPRTRQQQPSSTEPPIANVPTPPASAPPTQPVSPIVQAQRVVSRPSVPPKSQALRTGGSVRGAQWPPPQPAQQQVPAANVEKALPMAPPVKSATIGGGGGLAALLAKDLQGVPDYPPARTSSARGAPPVMDPGNRHLAADTGDGTEDLEADFSKRYPDLGGIEMVETEIGSGSAGGDGGAGRRAMRVKEV